MVRRKPNEEVKKLNLHTTVKHDGGGVMVWGCFSASNLGNLTVQFGILFWMWLKLLFLGECYTISYLRPYPRYRGYLHLSSDTGRRHCPKTINQSCFTHSVSGGEWKICFYTFVTHSYDNKSFLTSFNMCFIWMGNVAPCRGNITHYFWGAFLVWMCSTQGLLTFLSHKQTLLWSCPIFFFGKNVQKTKKWIKLLRFMVPKIIDLNWFLSIRITCYR